MRKGIDLVITSFFFFFLMSSSYAQRYKIVKDYPRIDYYKFGFGPEQRLQEVLNYYVPLYQEKKVKEVKQYVQIRDSKGRKSRKFLLSKETYNQQGCLTADEKYVLTEDFKTRMQKRSIYNYKENKNYLEIKEIQIGPKVYWPYLNIFRNTPNFPNDTLIIKITQPQLPTWDDQYKISKTGFSSKRDTIFHFEGIRNSIGGLAFEKRYYKNRYLKSFLKYRPQPKILFNEDMRWLSPNYRIVDYFYDFNKAHILLDKDSSMKSIEGDQFFYKDKNINTTTFFANTLMPNERTILHLNNKKGTVHEFMYIQIPFLSRDYPEVQELAHNYIGYIKEEHQTGNLLTKEVFKVINYLEEEVPPELRTSEEDRLYILEGLDYEYQGYCEPGDLKEISRKSIVARTALEEVKKREICTLTYEYKFW